MRNALIESGRPRLTAKALVGLLAAAGSVLLVTVPGCGGDDDAVPDTGTCTNGGGPVSGPADTHCLDAPGDPVIQEIGKCQTGAIDEGSAGAGGAGGEAQEEPYETRYSNSAADDDCKYDASFSSTCITVGKPVTFTLELDKRSGGMATGAVPDSPEIFLEANHSHISPSNAIKAPEGPAGTYEIGPVVFDRSGRWVVRFHFFEWCSDVPEDSPHGHVAFYIDVP